MIITINLLVNLFLRRIQARRLILCRNMCKTMLKSLHFTSILILGFYFLPQSLKGQASADAGKTTFRNYCAQCHARDMKTKATGPALGGAEANWAEFPKEDLYNWIRNSQALISAGHPRATALWNEWKPTVMTAFPNLTDEDIESVLLYIDQEFKGTADKPAGVAAGTGATPQDTSGQYNWLYYLLFALLLVLSIILARIIRSLDTIISSKEGGEIVEKSFVQRIFNKKVISFGIFALVVFGGFTTVNNAIHLGRQQGYAPDQPIQFSHQTHAGENQIDCQYCHDGARRSKHAVIPAANTCMNCHAAIQNGSKFGTAELSKIYASVGYDPNTGQYIDAYNDLSEDEIKAVYTKWIEDQYLNETGLMSLDKKGEQLVSEQWTNIKNSLTNGQKKQIPGSIEWTRVHNLPDHVFFNHSQHVAVGGLECQTCHGKVEEMETMQQYAPLSMGWCVNCHRRTEVKFEGNAYYESYENYHNQLAKGLKQKVTVEDIGGLECQKCHY